MEDHVEVGDKYNDLYILGKENFGVTFTNLDTKKSYAIRLLCIRGEDAKVEFSDSVKLGAEVVGINSSVVIKDYVPTSTSLNVTLLSASEVVVDIFESTATETALPAPKTSWATKVINKLGGHDALYVISTASLVTLALTSIIC